MRSTYLARRNALEMLRDPLSLGIAVALPLVLLFALEALGGASTPYLTATLLTPGIVLFGFVMIMFSSAMILARDRETSLLARLLTAPVRSRDFVAGYSLPYLAIALLQGAVLLAVQVDARLRRVPRVRYAQLAARAPDEEHAFVVPEAALEGAEHVAAVGPVRPYRGEVGGGPRRLSDERRQLRFARRLRARLTPGCVRASGLVPIASAHTGGRPGAADLKKERERRFKAE